MRRLARETVVRADDLIWPLFVHDRAGDEAVASMPGVARMSIDSLLAACERAVAAGVRAVAVFPSIEAGLKDAEGSMALRDDNLVCRAVGAVKSRFPELVVVTDVALDPFTSHGHDGLLNEAGGDVDNDATVEVLCAQAVLQAAAGADVVAPSDMMDGRVGAIREALDAEGMVETAIMAYSVKYASAFYGPFRDAVGSKVGKDAISKAGYQMDPANRREALREAALDEEEGADILMVKPAGPYLDIVREVADASSVPVAAYQVSGEYSQIKAAERLGWLDGDRVRDESLLAIKRAGADMILTYFALEVAEGLARRGAG
jgi:porphobilinogen synthase